MARPGLRVCRRFVVGVRGCRKRHFTTHSAATACADKVVSGMAWFQSGWWEVAVKRGSGVDTLALLQRLFSLPDRQLRNVFAACANQTCPDAPLLLVPTVEPRPRTGLVQNGVVRGACCRGSVRGCCVCARSATYFLVGGQAVATTAWVARNPNGLNRRLRDRYQTFTHALSEPFSRETNCKPYLIDQEKHGEIASLPREDGRNRLQSSSNLLP